MVYLKKIVMLVTCLSIIVSGFSTAEASEVLTRVEKAEILYELGLFDGVSETEFIPDLEATANREQAVKIIVKAFGWSVDEQAVTDFVDVSSWAQPYVAVAVDRSLTDGSGVDSDGSPLFGATNSITERQLQTWLDRLMTGSATAWDDNAGLDNLLAINRGDIVEAIYNALIDVPVGMTSSLIENIVADDSEMISQAIAGGLITVLPLSIKTIDVISDEEILLVFSDAITDTAYIEDYYSLEQSGDTIAGIIKDVDKTASNQVKITFKEALSGSYTINVDGVISRYGEVIDDEGNFYISDKTSASIDSIHVASVHMIVITCTEKLDETTVTDEDNYELYDDDGDQKDIIKATTLTDDDEITMTFSDGLDGEYTIEIDGVEGADGNTMNVSKVFEVNIVEELVIQDIEVDDFYLTVIFSSPVDEESAENQRNYTIYNADGEDIDIIIDDITLADDNEVCIELESIEGIDMDGVLTLAVTGVESEYGDRFIDDEVIFELD